MSAQPTPFPAQAKVIRLALTPVASAAVQLPAAANQIRIVNHGADAYFSITDRAGEAVATVPNAVASTNSTPVLGGSDVTLTIPNDSAKWISGILDAGGAATSVDVMVGEGL